MLHEQIHIKRYDHLIKFLCTIILMIHWFNPMVWIAYIYLNKDMELSCDEKVLQILGQDIRADYSRLLLNFSSLPSISVVAFSKQNTKERIKNV